MELQIRERFVLLSILSQGIETDFTTLKLVRELRESLSFNEEEHAKYKFRQEGSTTLWDNDAGEVKDIPIGEKVNDIIINALKKLNEDKKLTDEHFSIYEKFVESKQE